MHAVLPRIPTNVLYLWLFPWYEVPKRTKPNVPTFKVLFNLLFFYFWISTGSPLVLWPPLSRKPYELDQISLNTTVGDYIRNPLKKNWLFGEFWFWSNFKPLYLGNSNNHTKSFLSLMASDTPLISSTFSLLRNQPRKQEGLRCQKGSGLFLYVDVYFSYNFDETF
jgi:hypothetical protein